MYLHPRLLSLASDVRWRIIISAVVGMLAVAAGVARRAIETERTNGADAGFVLFSWAHGTGDYVTAALAAKALYRNTGARRQLRRLLNRYVDVTAAAETDRSLLLCAHGASARHEPAR